MAVIFDAHVHLYEEYDLSLAVRSAQAHFAAAPVGGEAARALILTERCGQAFFRRLASGRCAISGYKVEYTPEHACLRIDGGLGPLLYVFPGRQIACAERIEVHALLSDIDMADGAPLAQVLDSLRGAGAVTGLPWALGKWFGKRGQVVGEAIEHAGYGNLLISDPALRPQAYPLPRLYERAKKKGIPYVCGTDPLPLAGEEERIGSYATLYRGAIDTAKPGQEMRRILSSALPSDLEPVGSRLGAAAALLRIVKLRCSGILISS